MQINNLQTNCYRIPLPAVLSDSTHGMITHFQLITVRVRDSDGLEGVGYTYTVGKGGSAVRSLIADDVASELIGMDPRRVEQVWERLWWMLHYVGRGGLASFAISAVDIALWDLNAKRCGEPLWRFLGGHDPRVPAYAGGIDLEFSLEELLQQTRDHLAQGFRAIKMKVGRAQLAEDVERVAAMRELLGDDVPLMVDANMRWSVEQAIRAARVLQEHNVYWLEEPTIPDDVSGHARVAAHGGVPIATGENLHTLYEFQRMIAEGGISFPEPDMANIGGITAWMKVAKLAEAHNLPVTSHGVHDLHVHLLAAVPNSSYLEVHGFGLDRFLTEPLQIEAGHAVAPDRPGHGVELNWDRLETCREA